MPSRALGFTLATLCCVAAGCLAVGCDDGADQPTPDATAPDLSVDADVEMAVEPLPDAGDPADLGPDAAPSPAVEPYAALAEPVEIIIDGEGLAHIYAQNDLDLFFAAGYQQAVDRLFAVDMARRQAVGTRAEVLGADGRSGDLQARVIGFRRLAQASLDRLLAEAPDEARFFAAFAGGLNRRVAEIAAGEAPAPPEYAALGFEPTPFEPVELLAIGVRITFGFSSTLEFDLLYTLMGRLAPGAAELRVFEPVGDAFVMGIPDDIAGGVAPEPAGLPKQGQIGDAPLDPRALDPAAIGAVRQFLRRWRTDLDQGEGSNFWVVAGEHTDDGRPILANDSHATFLDPNVMYPVHLNSADAGGTWDAIGMAFTGVPGVQVGHNRRVAWGATTHFADMLDLWDVDIRDGLAQVGGEAVAVEARVETFAVRQPDGSLVEESVTVRFVPGLGLVLPPEMLDGIPLGLVVQGELVIGWPGFEEPTLDALSYFDMARAEDVDAWVDAVRLQAVGMQNWMAADAEGIRYQTAGRVPDRGPLEGRPTANQVMDADDPGTLWTRGFFDADALPALRDTAYLYSANNDPWGHTADNEPLNDPFYYGSFYSPGFRAAYLKRLIPRILAEGPMTRARSQEMQLDVFSPWADEFIPWLTAAVAAIDGDPALADFVGRDELRAAAERLQLWDRRMTLDSTEATLFRMWGEYVGRRLLEDDLGLLFGAIAEEEPVYVAKFATTTLRYDIASLIDMPRDAFLLSTFDEALTTFTARGEPAWEAVHRAVLRAPDGTARTLATPGGDSSLNVAQSLCWGEDDIAEHCRSGQGAVYRFVTGFAADGTPESDFACPACLPDSDQRWIDGEFRRLPFRRADVDAAAAEVRMLLP